MAINQQTWKVWANSSSYEDLIEFLTLINIEVSDVRISLAELSSKELQDTIELRKALSGILQSAIDKLRRIRENQAASMSKKKLDQSGDFN